MVYLVQKFMDELTSVPLLHKFDNSEYNSYTDNTDSQHGQIDADCLVKLS